jgi:hypothetical protein
MENMKPQKNFPKLTRLAVFTLLFSIGFGLNLPGGNAQAQLLQNLLQVTKLAPDLLNEAQGAKNGNDQSVSVIVQLNGQPSAQLSALLQQNGVSVRGTFQQLNSYAVQLPASMIRQLAALPEVEFVSKDAVVTALGHVTKTTA